MMAMTTRSSIRVNARIGGRAHRNRAFAALTERAHPLPVNLLALQSLTPSGRFGCGYPPAPFQEEQPRAAEKEVQNGEHQEEVNLPLAQRQGACQGAEAGTHLDMKQVAPKPVCHEVAAEPEDEPRLDFGVPTVQKIERDGKLQQPKSDHRAAIPQVQQRISSSEYSCCPRGTVELGCGRDQQEHPARNCQPADGLVQGLHVLSFWWATHGPALPVRDRSTARPGQEFQLGRAGLVVIHAIPIDGWAMV